MTQEKKTTPKKKAVKMRVKKKNQFERVGVIGEYYVHRCAQDGRHGFSYMNDFYESIEALEKSKGAMTRNEKK